MGVEVEAGEGASPSGALTVPSCLWVFTLPPTGSPG